MDATVERERVDALDEVKKRAAVLIAKGLKNKKVAEFVGRDEHTIARWKHEPAFHAAVEAAGDAIDAEMHAEMSQFVSDVRELKGEALSTLRELLHEQDPAMRLKAAEAILKV